MGSSTLVAVVVTYNRPEQLATTLGALLTSPPSVLSAVIVFDNGSDAPTQTALQNIDDPRVLVVRSGKNLGGAGGFDQGMRAAVQTFKPDWVVLMDDDARPSPGALECFAKHDRSGAAAWAAAVTYPDGTVCDMNRPWKNPFKSTTTFLRSLFLGRDGFHIKGDETEQLDIDGTSFVGLFVSKDAIKRHGYPDPTLFLYGDDVLYTIGISSAGHRLIFDPAIRFEHDCDSFSSNKALRPLWKAYFYHRNLLLVYRVAAGPILFWGVAGLRLMQWWMTSGKYGAARSDYLMLLRLAAKDGLLGRKSYTLKDIQHLLTR